MVLQFEDTGSLDCHTGILHILAMIKAMRYMYMNTTGSPLYKLISAQRINLI